MTVYLLHFERPYEHAGHYLGFTTSERTLGARLEHHRAGTGANLLRVITEAGIDFGLVRVWPEGTQTLERKLKAHSSTRLCPVCSSVPRQVRGFESYEVSNEAPVQ